MKRRRRSWDSRPAWPGMKLYNELAYLWPVISPPETYAEEAEHWRKAIRDKLGEGRHHLLELGVGGGHNLSHLTSDFQATAVDIAPRMLELSRQLNPGVDHHLGDMRSVRLGRTFDAVLAHDAIGYMLTEDDLRAAMNTARVHLRPGGLLLVAPDLVWDRFYEGMVHQWSGEADSIRVDTEERLVDRDPLDTIVESHFTYTIYEKGTVRTERDLHISGIFPIATWTRLMEEAGFFTEVRPLPGNQGGYGDHLFAGVLRGPQTS